MNQRLRIAIDANEANTTSRVGSNVYAFEVLRALHALVHQSLQSQQLHVTLLLSAPPVSDMPQPTEQWQYQVFGPRKWWTQWALPLYLLAHRHQFDVLYTPGHYAPRYSPIPYVSSVMDTAYVEFPDQFKRRDYLQLKHWTAYSVKRAAYVVTISQASARALTKLYQVDPAKVVVTYPGLAQSQQVVPANRQALLLNQHHIQPPYILYLGTIQPRKNLERLIEGYEILVRMFWSRSLSSKRSHKQNASANPPQLVIAGKTGWLAQPVLDRINQSKLAKHIVLTGYVSDELKQTLLRNATCTALVGLHEGFGIPPLESMSLGTPAVVADTTSLPEVVGDAGIVVDPYQPAAIAEGLWQAYSLTAKQRAQLRRKMRLQVAKFSWEQAGQTILTTITKAAAKKA